MLRLKLSILVTLVCFFTVLAAPLYAVPKLDASDMKKKQVKIHKFLLAIYKSQNRHNEAIKEFPVLINLTPNDAHLRFEYGLYLAKTGDDRRALVELKKARRMDPANADILSAMGVIYLRQKKYKEACNCFSDAIRAGGDSKKNKEMYEKARKYVDYMQKRKIYERKQKEHLKRLEDKRRQLNEKASGGDDDDDW